MTIYQKFQVRNDADITVDVIVQTLRRAQVLSQTVAGDSEWGVSVVNDAVVLFRGATFATRDTDFDEDFPIPNTLTYTGPAEIIFSKLYGLPSTTGQMSITTQAGHTNSITINSKGILEY